MTTIHDFNDQLAYSERASCEPFWNAVYRKAFPNMVNHMICSGNTQSQRMGVDRIVYLGNDKEIRIDEKKRKKSYGDVILEYISVDTTGAPGWMEKDLAIDYLAYAIMTTKQCYLFPWQLLRRVWCRFGREWIELAKQNERASAIGAAWDHVQRAHEKCMAALNRRIVTEEDLATLGIKRLDGNP